MHRVRASLLPRIPHLRTILATLGLASLVPACSLLVDFVDASCDGGSCADASPEATLDAKPDVADAAPFDASRICQGKLDGYYCGYNGLNGQPPPDWRVRCVDGGPIVTVCDAGCVAFPNGYADRCNECPGFANGDYCGSQFAGYGASNSAFLISCGQGIAAIQVLCANGCQPGPGDASCK